MNNIKTTNLINTLLLFTLIYIIYKTSLYFIDIIAIYFLMFFFSIILKPIVEKINEKYKFSREFTTLIIIFFFFSILLTLLFILIPSVYNSLKTFTKTLQENLTLILTSGNEIINKYLKNFYIEIEINNVYQNIINTINQNIPQITEKMINIVFSGGKTIFNILLIAVLTFYMIKDYEKIREYKIKIISFLLNTDKKEIENLYTLSEETLRKFLIGQLIAALYIFLFTLISLYFFGVKEYFLVATISGIFELIPFIGAFIAFSLSILFILSKGLIPTIIFITLAIIAYQVLAKIIYPNVVGKILNISVITVLLSIIIGFKLYGIFGMFIAVPTMSIIKNILDKKINNRS